MPVTFESVAMYIGVASGVVGVVGGLITLFKVYRDVVKLLNDFQTKDALHETRMQHINNKIERVDGDVRDLHRDMVEHHNSMRNDITLALTRVRDNCENWDEYVDNGTISKEQLQEIRKKCSNNTIQ